jgi:hypothetical protein
MILKMKEYKKLFYDFEVFSNPNCRWWCVTFIDYDTREKTIILNDKKQLENFYKVHKDDIFIGYNSRNYDQWILKAILLGKDPFKINDGIIEQGKNGYQLLRNGKDVKLNNFDVSNIMNSLKQLEGFMGSMIKESSIPFDLDRPLTDDEIEETIKYNVHDVEETIKVFDNKREDFDSQLLLIDTFDLGMELFNKTKAQLSAHILGTVKQSRIDDEFDFVFPHNLKLDKYKFIYNWYKNPRNLTYKRKLEVDVAGVPHTFAFGGVHGAKLNYKAEGIILCADVASLYPSIMINYGFLSRNVQEPQKFTEIRDTRIKLKHAKDKRQGALKIVINGTYGASKDPNNALNDPQMANNVCITGQLLLLDLIEKVESYGELIQSNTDGIYMLVKDMETVNKIKEIAHEWETRTELELEWDIYSKIFQRDVNNYIIVSEDGHYKSKGCVKKKSPIDYDMPILTRAVIDYCVKGTSVEDTINNCDDLIEFQKIVKVSSLYKSAFYGTVKQIDYDGSKVTVIDKGDVLPEKVLRVFASNNDTDKGVFKIKSDIKVEKIANTPDRCFINNENMIGLKCPKELDKEYYIKLATEMLEDFLGMNDTKKIKISNEQQVIEILNSNPSNFYDILEQIKLNTKISNIILNKFIIIDVFNRYGKSKKLIRSLELFKVLYNKKSAKGVTLRKSITEDWIFEILKANSEYNEEKDKYDKLNSRTALELIFQSIPNEDISIINKVRQEFDLYDDITIKDESIDENIIFIMNVNDTKNPSIIAYNIKYGSTNILKIPKEIFNILEIRERDFVKIKNIQAKPKVCVIGKDSNGINLVGEKANTQEWWITEYEIINRDYGKNDKLIIDDEMDVIYNGR